MKYKLQPWQHQLDAIERAKDMDHYGLFFEVGCGKSCAAANLLRYKCYLNKRLLRTLILCPPVVVENWRREMQMHTNISKVTPLVGAGKKRLETFKNIAFDDDGMREGHVFITNYEALSMKDLYWYLNNWLPEVLIVDESHRLKSIKAKRTKLAIQLADKVKYKYLLTGTPILNTPMDLFSQFRVLDGGQTFGKNFFAFRAKYFWDKNANMPAQKYFPDWRPKPNIEAEFNERIYKKATRVLKKDCLDLPPLVKKQVFAEMSSEQARLYKGMKKDFLTFINDKACTASLALTKALRLQQIVSGFIKTAEEEGGEEISFDKCPRLDALWDTLEPILGKKVIIWAVFRKNYEQILALLDKKKVTGTCLLYGGMTAKKRQESIDLFQEDPEHNIMIAHPGAGGIGINLTAASYSVYYSRNFSLEQDIQSEARNYRGGSQIHDKITRIDLVTPGTIDEIILDALKKKVNLAEDILALKDKL